MSTKEVNKSRETLRERKVLESKPLTKRHCWSVMTLTYLVKVKLDSLMPGYVATHVYEIEVIEASSSDKLHTLSR